MAVRRAPCGYAGGSESVQENVVHWWREVEVYRI